MAMKYKENIANLVPEVADLNALDSNLYTARDLIANRALRGNKSIGLKEFFNSPPSTSYLARQAFKVADAGSLSDKAKLAIAAAIQGGNQALPSNINYLQRQ